MKLVALTYGTEGDTRPLAAVCHALMGVGYEVTLLVDGGTLGSALDLGVPRAALAGDIRGKLQSASRISSFVAVKNSLNATAKAMAQIANENADAWMRQILDVAAGSDGLIVAGLAAYIGFSAAEKLAIPVIGAGAVLAGRSLRVRRRIEPLRLCWKRSGQFGGSDGADAGWIARVYSYGD